MTASKAADDAFNDKNAKGVFEQYQKAYDAQRQVEHYRNVLKTHFTTSIAGTNDLAAELAYSRAESSVESYLVTATKAFENAKRHKAVVEFLQRGTGWSQEAETPVLSDAETKRQEAIADAQAARDAANRAITKAARLRQDADALAEKAYAIQETAKTKVGSEKDAEMQRFREMTVDLPEALQSAKKAEQDAKEADDLAIVRANDAGIPSQDLQQREQSPWGDILGSSENSKQLGPFDSIQMPRSIVGRRMQGTIVCALPRGQLVVTVSDGDHLKAYVLSSTHSVERKEYKEHGGIQLEYEDVESYDDDEVTDIHDLDPVLVAVQTAKASKRTVLVILIAKRNGYDGIRLYNMSRLKAIFPASEVAKYLNQVREKQGQDPVCPVTQKLKRDEDSARKEAEWKVRNNMP
ncbi:hypothetical protein B0J15DRAFT_462716 [Fusarium solani]|uniref:Uncharacterized protein n=1 Tax=Fusarium solani TaxID=169388 RepID=A0A9P9R806_FUSSL|nr:uncharacterized protein B0J15DRAFT_462716 [Fusarium solani]KAH7268718.1 hypothetical protein B0J15DRAFT_462716 [Fusarium solani]